jgi:hypothetical protein
MIIEILEYIFHWLFSIYGGAFFCIVLFFVFYFIPILRIPLLIYFIIIQFKEPSIKEIDFWTKIREKYFDNFPIKKDVYKNTFKTVYHGTSKEEIIKPSDNGKGKLITFHPHGMCSVTHMASKLFREIELYQSLRNTKVASHIAYFRTPVLREISLLFGLMPATKKNIDYYLNEGVNVCLVPGGIREVEYCKEHIQDEYAYIKKRNGFLNIISNKYENIQIYTLGEQQFFSYYYEFPSICNKIFSAFIGKNAQLHSLNLFRPYNLYKWHKIWTGTSDKTITYIGETHKYTGDLEKDKELYIERLEKLFYTICEKEKINKKLIIV